MYRITPNDHMSTGLPLKIKKKSKKCSKNQPKKDKNFTVWNFSQDFRSNVARSATLIGDVGALDLRCEPEVRQFDVGIVVLRGQQEILGFEVSAG